MLTIQNVKLYPEIEWDNYCSLKGKSFSGIKHSGVDIPETMGIKIGKLVHSYLLKPKEYTWEMSEVVVPIARTLMSFVKPELMLMMKMECGVTADFIHEGMTMPYKGLLDAHIAKLLLIDFKVLSGDLDNAVKFFRYDEQTRGYALPIETDTIMIISYNKKTKQVQHKFISYDPRWWCYQVKRYGTPISLVKLG